MNGIINICKQPEWTSSDVVNKLKGILRQKHIGHAGTLDPGAAGVLPVCVGKATRLFDYMTKQPKTYIAEITFGSTTDTQDSYGSVLRTAPVLFTASALEEVLSLFLGDISQTPPMYSAIKQNGKRLYELARAGKTAEIAPRIVKIYSLRQVTPLKDNRCMLEIVCGKGTYIRTICVDLGEKLGCGAHMSFLLRKNAGGLDIQDSYSLREIEEMAGKEDFSFLHPADSGVDFLPAVYFRDEAFKALCNGNQLDKQELQSTFDRTAELVRVYCRGAFFGIAQLEQENYRMKCMLFEEV